MLSVECRVLSVWVSSFGFRVSGFGYRVSGFGYRVSGIGYRFLGFVFRVSVFGFRVSVFGFRVSDFGSRVSGFGSRFPVLRSRVSCFRFQVPGFGYRVSSFGSRISGLGSRVSGFVFRVLCFGFQVSVLGLGSRVSGLGFRVSDFGHQVPGFGFRASNRGAPRLLLGGELNSSSNYLRRGLMVNVYWTSCFKTDRFRGSPPPRRAHARRRPMAAVLKHERSERIGSVGCRCRSIDCSRKVDIMLPERGNSNYHGARPVYFWAHRSAPRLHLDAHFRLDACIPPLRLLNVHIRNHHAPLLGQRHSRAPKPDPGFRVWGLTTAHRTARL